MKITQLEMKKIKSLATKKGRQVNQLFIAEGIRMLEEALNYNMIPKSIYFCNHYLSERGKSLVAKFAKKRLNSVEISAKQLDQISDSKSSQGIVAIFEIPKVNLSKLSTTNCRNILVCENISDPGNLGSLLRSALAFDFGAVVLLGGTTDCFSPKVVRSSAGAIFGLKLIDIELKEFENMKKNENIFLVATDVLGNVDLSKMNYKKKNIAVAIGSEAFGLSQEILDISDARVKIPHSNSVESLNAAVSGAIVLHQIYQNGKNLMNSISSKIKAIVIFAFFSVVTPTVYSQQIYEESDNLYTTAQLESQISYSKIRKIIISSASQLSGKIEVTAESIPGVSIQYKKKAKAKTKSQAIDYIDLIALSMTAKPEVIEINLRAPNPAPWVENQEAGILEISIQVPYNCEITFKTQLFDIVAEGPFKQIIIPSSLERIIVEDVSQLLDISTTNQKIKMTNIRGEISASTTNAKLEARVISSLKSQASFKNDGGDIVIDDLTGLVNIKNNYGRITLKNFNATEGKNFIRGFSAPVTLEILKLKNAHLTILNRFEDIEIFLPEDVSANFSLAVEDGNKIEAADFEFSPRFIQENRLTLKSGNGESSINSTIRGEGNIYILGVEN